MQKISREKHHKPALSSKCFATQRSPGMIGGAWDEHIKHGKAYVRSTVWFTLLIVRCLPHFYNNFKPLANGHIHISVCWTFFLVGKMAAVAHNSRTSYPSVVFFQWSAQDGQNNVETCWPRTGTPSKGQDHPFVVHHIKAKNENPDARNIAICWICWPNRLVNSIWINYNDSLTWIKAIKGDDFPCQNHDSRLRSQWAIEAHRVDKLTGG